MDETKRKELSTLFLYKDGVCKTVVCDDRVIRLSESDPYVFPVNSYEDGLNEVIPQSFSYELSKLEGEHKIEIYSFTPKSLETIERENGEQNQPDDDIPF